MKSTEYFWQEPIPFISLELFESVFVDEVASVDIVYVKRIRLNRYGSNIPIKFVHLESEEALGPETVGIVEDILVDSLFDLWMKERMGVKAK